MAYLPNESFNFTAKLNTGFAVRARSNLSCGCRAANQFVEPRSRQFQPVGPAQCSSIYKAAGEVRRFMQIFKQRALAARQVIRPVKYAVGVVAESQFKLVGRNGFGIQ
jgi:hypothetical protein